MGRAGVPGQDARGVADPPGARGGVSRRRPSRFDSARLARAGVALATTAVLSLAYMTFVTLVPESSRPYVDGSTTDSVFHQVFVYNGYNRVGQASPNTQLAHTLGTPLLSQFPAGAGVEPAAHRWVRPRHRLAAAGGARGARVRPRRARNAPRRDPPRAGALMWGLWLVVLAVVFTTSTTMNSYFTGSAIAGSGGAPRDRGHAGLGTPAVRAVLLGVAGVVLVTAGYAAWLLPARGPGCPPGSSRSSSRSAWRPRRDSGWPPRRGAPAWPARTVGTQGPARRRRPIVLVGAACLAGGALLLVPVVATASVVAESARALRHAVPAGRPDGGHPCRLRADVVAAGCWPAS